MKKIVLLLFIFLIFSVLTVFSQIHVKINVRTDDTELRNQIVTQLESKIGALKDVKISPKNHFTLSVSIIKRKVSDDTFDYYFSVLATAKEACVVGRDSKGRVDSTRGCVEQLTNHTYAGRKEDIPEIVKDVIKKFDSNVIQPQRDIRAN